MSKSSKPLNHLAIIMDGNGRWAKQRHLPRILGHKEGMKNIRNISLKANELGIKVLTVYAFSTENWARPDDEVNYLMKLPIDFFGKYMPELMENNVKVNIMGYDDKLPEKTLSVIKKAMQKTSKNTGMILNIAFNYGSRREIVTVVKNIAKKINDKEIKIDQIDDEMISDYLLTEPLKPYDEPDLLIRTSGEKRISNFLLWQIAYTELNFSGKLWPDFDEFDLKEMIDDYKNRDRRFGKL